MSASFFGLILTFSVFCGSGRFVSAELRSPNHVRLTSYNMNMVLKWEPPDAASDGVLYTAQYKSSVSQDRTACVNVSTLECDFTPFNISLYGKYTGRVQAQLGTESSAWVRSNAVTLDKDTIIGPPSVSLFPSGASLEVTIKDPVFRISSLRSVYSGATYNLSYWKEDEKENAKSHQKVKQTRLILSDLDPWTQYCVQVQINTAINNNPSEPSSLSCKSTTAKHRSPWVAAVVVFFSMAVAVVLVVVLVVHWRNISRFLCPKDPLPAYLKDYLLTPAASTVCLAMQNLHPPEEVYDQVNIVAEDGTIKEGGPPETAEDTCSKEPDVTVVNG